MIVGVMGVSGSGKTTIGTMLAEALRCPFLEGDLLHPAANVEKMSRGVPLTDVDRAPWLDAIHARLLDAFRRGLNLVVACSALKQSYRAALGEGLRIAWVYLKGPEELIRSRLRQRTDHFMKEDLLASQFEDLEEPADAIVADVSRPPAEIVRQILVELRVKPDVRVAENVNELSLGAAEEAARTMVEAVRAAGRCSVVLSGGSTPRTLHRLLASRFREEIPWTQVHVFWGDERYVPHDDARSNFRMAMETLLRHVPCPPANVHPMPTHLPDPDAAAQQYEATLRKYFARGEPRFDLALLGVGPDGHTASLFPGSAALDETVRWVLPVTAPAEPPLRLTLTLPVLTRTAHTHVLVTGASKAPALRCALSGTPDPTTCPAAALRLAEGTVTWWVDREAAAQLE